VIRRFISQVLCGAHHGRGSKYTRKGKHVLALKHFQIALKHALASGAESYVPLEMECVARTHVRLGNYDEAQKYAAQSLDLYKKLQGTAIVFDEGVKRVVELMRKIEGRGSI